MVIISKKAVFSRFQTVFIRLPIGLIQLVSVAYFWGQADPERRRPKG